MSADQLIASFLHIAREDLAGARLLAEGGNRNALYLAEQAAEKIIRAVLASESIPGRISHDLRALVDPIPDENPIKPLLRTIEHLAVYATSYRYPTTPYGGIPRAKHGVEEALDAVQDALAEVAARLAVDLERPGAAARRPGPIR